MLGHHALIDVFGDERLVEVGGMGIGALLGDDHLADELRVAAAAGDSQTGGDGLGVAGEQYHVIGGIEGLDEGHDLAGITERRIGVVLDHEHIVIGGELGGHLPRLDIHDGAGGVLEGGDGVEHHGAVLFDCFRKLIGMDAVRVHGDGDYVRLSQLEDLDSA